MTGHANGPGLLGAPCHQPRTYTPPQRGGEGVILPRPRWSDAGPHRDCSLQWYTLGTWIKGGRGSTLSPLRVLWDCQPGAGTVTSMSCPETPGSTHSTHPFPGSHLASCQGKGRSRTHATLGGGQQVARQGWGRGSWRGHVYDDCFGCRRAVEKQDHTGS